MRDHTTPLFKQLAAAGARAPTVTPGASIQSTTFNLIGFTPTTDDMLNYLQDITVRVTTVVDQPAMGGSVINWDKLPKVIDSFRINCPLLGEIYPAAHTSGAEMFHFQQVLGGGYTYPQPARAQIAAADGDTTIDLYFVIPFSFEFLKKPHETAPWISLLESGELEVRFAASTALDGDSTGAVTKATTTIRAWASYLPSSDKVLPVPFQFRRYTVPGGGTEFILRNVAGASGWRGTEPGGGLAALVWYTDATGMGLSGADGVDEINRIDIPFRAQESIDTVEPYFVALRRLARHHKVGPVGPTTSLVEASGWPYTQAATVNNTLANAQALFLPIIMPGWDAETSKFQRVRGDLRLNLGFGTTPSGSSRFQTLEFLEFSAAQKALLMKAMGIDPNTHGTTKKSLRKNNPDARKLRFVRDTIRPVGPGAS